MAVGLTEPDKIIPIAGVELASVAAGIKKNGHDDLVVFLFAESTTCAATFTQNAFCAAPVTLAKKHLSLCAAAQQHPRALLINSGNANAGTGKGGMDDAEQSCRWLAEALQLPTEQILPFSTGVIGERLPLQAMQSGIAEVVTKLSESNWLPAATGIMTTDTVAKAISKTIILNNQKVTISGIAKGSGMICPNMATMLAFIATDANIEADCLQQCLSAVVENSFNAITVDGDTSTNDACVLVATGVANNEQLGLNSSEINMFTSALSEVCQQLAQSIIRDAEGATKFVTVKVEQAASKVEAKKVAYTIAHSPLVKTALFASDPNWGRILAAVGRAEVENLDVSAVNIYLDKVCIVRNGGVDGEYTEEQGQSVMNQSEIQIKIELGRGGISAEIWTSDLSHEYVRINSEYRS